MAGFQVTLVGRFWVITEALWNVSVKTIRRLFQNEPGVLRLTNAGTGKRRYALLSIPASVALRVHERFSDQPFETALAGRHPLRVIHLRDLDARVPKQPRNVIKLKAS